jgi:hypothetical protein
MQPASARAMTAKADQPAATSGSVDKDLRKQAAEDSAGRLASGRMSPS